MIFGMVGVSQTPPGVAPAAGVNGYSSLIFWPVSARRILRSMRRAAKSPLASRSAWRRFG